MKRPDRDSPQLPLLEPLEKLSGFRVRRSKRARRLSIQIHPPGLVEVVVPDRTPPQDVESFVSVNADWIRETCSAMSVRHEDPTTDPPSQIQLAALGQSWSVRYSTASDRRLQVLESDDKLVVYGADDDVAKRLALIRWLKRKARALLVPVVGELSLKTRLRPKRVQIRAQRSRWGSCSSHRTLSLNVCLLFQDIELVRYLVTHELCHLRQMNHSEKFWQLVESHAPGARMLDEKLGEGWANIPGWLLAEL